MLVSRRSVLGSLALIAGGKVTAPYVRRELGSRTQTGVKDNAGDAGVNPFLPLTGWDVIFHPADFNVPDPEFECYHIALDGPVGSSLAVLINGKFWDYVNQGWKNGWDPSQPMLIRTGESVQFCWNVAATVPPFNQTTNILPSVTMWLRHPPSAVPAG